MFSETRDRAPIKPGLWRFFLFRNTSETANHVSPRFENSRNVSREGDVRDCTDLHPPPWPLHRASVKIGLRFPLLCAFTTSYPIFASAIDDPSIFPSEWRTDISQPLATPRELSVLESILVGVLASEFPDIAFIPRYNADRNEAIRGPTLLNAPVKTRKVSDSSRPTTKRNETERQVYLTFTFVRLETV